MIYSLVDYIDTDYCLVVQNDGWVLNGQNWRDEFWHYDYIGSPVSIGFELLKDRHNQPYFKTHKYFNCSITEKCDDVMCYSKEDKEQQYPLILPQNGGFSFRSKRFLEMPRKLGISVPVFAPKVVEHDQPFHFDWNEFPAHSEDLFLTVAIRKQLEEAGIKYAPVKVAGKFGFNTVEVTAIPDFDRLQCLGHHFFHKIELTGYNNILMKLEPKHVNGANGLPSAILDVLAPFVNAGYKATVTVSKT